MSVPGGAALAKDSKAVGRHGADGFATSPDVTTDTLGVGPTMNEGYPTDARSNHGNYAAAATAFLRRPYVEFRT